MHNRTVFFVSDGTGITAETFGNAILAQFEIPMKRPTMRLNKSIMQLKRKA